MTKKYILIGHRKRVGKDTFAQFLKEALGDKAEIMAYATPMKEMVAEMLGLNMEQLEDMKNDTNSTVRTMLIAFGNGKIKEYFGKSVWRDLLIKRAEQSDVEYIIVPDFRFPEEYIEGAVTIKVDRDTVKCDGNEADVALSNYAFDVLVHNDRDLNALRGSAAHFVKEFGEKYGGIKMFRLKKKHDYTPPPMIGMWISRKRGLMFYLMRELCSRSYQG